MSEDPREKASYLTINGYKWEVSETGTYYVLDGGQLKMVDGEGTHTYNKGVWSEASGNKVSITGQEYHDASGAVATADSGVELTEGTDDEKSPRNATVILTNNKSEMGSITASKKLFYNGMPDTTKGGQKVKFGLYRDAMKDELARGTGLVTLANGTKVVAVQETTESGIVMNPENSATYTGTLQNVVREAEFANGESSCLAVFSGLPYTRAYDYTYSLSGGGTQTDHNIEQVAYHVLELNSGDSPITGKAATFDFGDGSKSYSVVGGDEAVYLDHKDREQTVGYTNSLKEQGSIEVTKRVFQSDGTTADGSANATASAAGAKFKVGLFTSDGKGGYSLVPGRVLIVEMGKGSDGVLLGDGSEGIGKVKFENLDFDVVSGTTYYVFEVDSKNNPVIPNQSKEGSDVLGDYRVSYETGQAGNAKTAAGKGRGITLTKAKHEFVNAFDSAQTTETNNGNQAGAVVSNIKNITKADLRILKVDRQSWVDVSAAVATDPTNTATAKPLQGATFEIKQVDENVKFNNEGVSYKQGGTTATATTDGDGMASFTDVTTGWYEVKETASPIGYLVVGDSTVYLKIENGTVVFLRKQQNVEPKNWQAIVPASYQAQDGCNVMNYTAAMEASGSTPATSATATVGNVAGPELPSTGGPGLWPLLFAGVVLAIASAAALLFERSRA